MELASCGLDCSTCTVYQATLAGDREAQARCIAEWQATADEHWGGVKLRPEDMVCRGCTSEAEPVFISCRRCPIRGCCRSKGFKTCAECAEWSTCGRLSGLLADVPAARENLQRLSTGGRD
jgi:hypothetical protein